MALAALPCTPLALRDDLAQEPAAALGLVDPVLDQAGSGYFIVFLAQLVCGTQVSRQLLVVGAKLSEHILGRHTFSVVVLQPLVLRNIADGPDRSPADFAPPLGDVVSHRKDLSALLIQEQVVVAEMWSTHVPVEVLGLDVQGKDVAQQLTKLARDLDHSFATEVC